jgi:hypothetical protein
LKRITRVEQSLCLGQRLVRRKHETFGQVGDARNSAGQGTTERITRAGVAGPPGFVPIAVDCHGSTLPHSVILDVGQTVIGRVGLPPAAAAIP